MALTIWYWIFTGIVFSVTGSVIIARLWQLKTANHSQTQTFPRQVGKILLTAIALSLLVCESIGLYLAGYIILVILCILRYRFNRSHQAGALNVMVIALLIVIICSFFLKTAFTLQLF